MAQPRIASARQGLIGLALAVLVFAAWTGLHVFAVWHLDAPRHPFLALLSLLGLTWLSVALFITAHDAMHGAIVPGRPRLNAALGGLALALFAGFSWRRLLVKHMAHHRFAGTEDDPDFGPGGPLRWYWAFLREYFGAREALLLGGSVIVYALILGPRWPYVAFWSLPSILASVQLFWFGTYLPHRPDPVPFSDRHNARSTAMSDPVSLLTCLHFGGYHHEHHLHPTVPWWRLPATRRQAGA